MKRMRVTVAMAAGAAAAAAMLGGPAASVHAVGGGQGGCVAHRAAYIEDVFEVRYSAGCSGHDEPELMPLSDLPGSAKNLTWTFVLPSNGSNFDVDAVGPTFWLGGTGRRPEQPVRAGVRGASVLPELRRHPMHAERRVRGQAPCGAWSVCSPTWSIHTTGQKPVYHEPAAFNAMLTCRIEHPLVMHQGDTHQRALLRDRREGRLAHHRHRP